MLNLSVILEEPSKRYPAKAAFIFFDKAYSYQHINSEANKVANGLINNGIKAGDKVALTCPNHPSFPIIYYGIIKSGAVVVPLNFLLKKDEIEYHLKNSDAKAYFCFAGTPDLPCGEMGYPAFRDSKSCEHFFIIMPSPGMPSPIKGVSTYEGFVEAQSANFEAYKTNADDTCAIIYTSGTTGVPKGAELTHANLLLNAITCNELVKRVPEDVSLIVLPLFHAYGMTALMNAAVYKGCSSVLLNRFEAQAVFHHMEKYKVTSFAGTPTMYWGLLNYSGPEFDYAAIASTLKSCTSGGGPLPVQVLEDFEKRFQVPILEGYGMTEGSPVVTRNQLEIGRKPGSIGTPIWGVEVKLVDGEGVEVPIGEKGELLFRGPNVMKGYYKMPEETVKTIQNGWLHSGDIATKDEDGFFYIVDRIKEMIIRSGFKVYPREVEEIMIKHPAVSLVAVIGIQHEELGEEIKAFVVLKENHHVSESDLITWTKERVASFKYPRYIEFTDSLPMNAAGKILKKELRKRQEAR